MGARILPLLILTLAVLLVISTSCFVVREQEMALRVQLSRIVSSDYEPGLHFKIPFVEDVVKFDRRVLTVKFNGEKFLTRESQALNIDYYIKWRIREASQYFQSTGGDELRAGGLLGDRIQDGIKNALARRTLSEIVTSDRQQVTGEFMAEAGKSMSSIGVEIVDVRLQRIDLQEDVASSVYENMKRGFESIARHGARRGREGEEHPHGRSGSQAHRAGGEVAGRSAAHPRRRRSDRRGDLRAGLQPQPRVLHVLSQPAGLP